MTKVKWIVMIVLAFALGAATGVYATAGMTNLSGLDITPHSYQTNSLVVRNSSGTAKVTVTKAGATTLAGALTASSTAAISGNTTIGGTLGVTGKVTLAGDLVSTDTGDIGWNLATGTDTACNTTCTSACVFGQDTTTYAIVDCADATADVCVCAGAN